MTGPLRNWLCLPAVVAVALCAIPARSCPFCTQQGQTLTGDVNQASLVLFGSLENPKGGAADNTDLTVEQVVKPNEGFKVPGKLSLGRYVEIPGTEKVKGLVFCDVFKGKVDPYRLTVVKDGSDLPKYLRGALDLKDSKPAERLKFFFNYLDNADAEVSNDAFKEFANAPYKDIREAAAGLSGERVARWLNDKDTPPFRIGSYASLLGHCGKPKDADLLRALLDDPEKRVTSGVDGILAGYTMLRPKEGWEYVRALLKDPSRDFMLRYAGLRAARFFWDYRTDLVGKKELAEGVAQLLDQSDISDLAIEDLRKWGRWELAGRVLAVRDTKAYEIPVVRRAVLRYALTCKDNAAAAAHVADQRKKDAQGVADAEELLKLEAGAGAAPAPTASK